MTAPSGLWSGVHFGCATARSVDFGSLIALARYSACCCCLLRLYCVFTAFTVLLILPFSVPLSRA